MPPQCARCKRPVYAAEEKSANGHKYHVSCYKCMLCNKLLDSNSVAEHGTELYCKRCHARKYGIHGVGYGQGAGCLSTDAGERFGNAMLGVREVSYEVFNSPNQAQHNRQFHAGADISPGYTQQYQTQQQTQNYQQQQQVTVP